ncbi:MAG: hypothetical protein M1813_000613 [Trichoglossum hirsutum]|nr:MAG: hypothetical protein M1813_000613 [Trichoglossum hirsutum]
MFDVKPENYGGGRARDFSQPWTAPNRVPIILKKDFRVTVAQFNGMIEEARNSENKDDTKESAIPELPVV